MSALLSAGSGPVTLNIGLRELGVEMIKHNKLVVDKAFTNVHGIYAIDWPHLMAPTVQAYMHS